jgi:hypothetical protein
LTRLQAHIGLFPALATTNRTLETLNLALDIGDLNGLNINLEQQFNRRLDFRLGSIGGNAKNTCSYLSAI